MTLRRHRLRVQGRAAMAVGGVGMATYAKRNMEKKDVNSAAQKVDVCLAEPKEHRANATTVSLLLVPEVRRRFDLHEFSIVFTADLGVYPFVIETSNLFSRFTSYPETPFDALEDIHL